MSRNGSGTYTLPAGNPVVSGTTITSNWANTTMQNIADGLTQSVASDGQTTMSGALNMGSNKVINVTDPTNAQDVATKAYVDASIPSTSNFLTKTGNLSDVTNATTSRTNLSAAKSGANSDITSITGLTTPLTVAQGGIGVATLTANNVLLGNGTSAPQLVAPSTSGNVLTSNGTTWVSSTPTAIYPLTSGTAQASTSGTSIDFTGLPSWVKRITVMFDGVSGSGASSFLIQLGTSGGVISTGYFSACSSGPAISSTAGFVVGEDSDSLIDTGAYVINQLSSSVWVGGGNFVRDSSTTLKTCAGKLTGSGTIDRVRITTVNGTDTFDAGSINILYE